MANKEDIEGVIKELLQETGLEYRIFSVFRPQDTAGEWVIHLTEDIQLKCPTDVPIEQARNILRQQLKSLG